MELTPAFWSALVGGAAILLFMAGYALGAARAKAKIIEIIIRQLGEKGARELVDAIGQ